MSEVERTLSGSTNARAFDMAMNISRSIAGGHPRCRTRGVGEGAIWREKEGGREGGKERGRQGGRETARDRERERDKE